MSRRLVAGLLTVALVIVFGAAGSLQQTRLNQLSARVDSLTTTVTVLTKGGRQTAPAVATVSVPKEGVLGEPSAPITIVEFLDYECPFCKKHAEETIPQIRSKYIQTGKVRYVVRHLPLAIHNNAKQAAFTARCAASINDEGFWKLHDLLLSADSALDAATIADVLRISGFDKAAVDECTRRPEIRAAVDEDIREANQVGISGTPAFVVGRAGPDGKIKGVVINGSVGLARFDDVIENALASKTKR
ncbi:MAG: DsbA family protein [Gemmatimonadota bacterium]